MSDLLHALLFIATFGLFFLGIIALEAWYWHRKGRKDIYTWRETLSSITTGAMYKIADGVAIALFIQFFYDWVYQFGFQYQTDDGWLSIVFLFFVVDFFYYFFHLGMHKIRWFWAAHVTHHSALKMNFSTALRQNFLIDLNFGWAMWWIPIALIGFNKEWAIIAIELNLAYQFFVHTETVRRLGPLEWILNTPSHHRVHHGSNPAQIDTNFGGVLIIWDRLFGTFVDERDAGPIRYGLVSRQPDTLNPLRLNLDEFFQMFRDAWRFRDWRVFIRPPGWVDNREPEIRPQETSSV